LFHADKETYTTKLIVDFCNFTNAPKNVREQFLVALKWADKTITQQERKKPEQ
jgi:hypothetical protein